MRLRLQIQIAIKTKGFSVSSGYLLLLPTYCQIELMPTNQTQQTRKTFAYRYSLITDCLLSLLCFKLERKLPISERLPE